jgi:hypothetical protein
MDGWVGAWMDGWMDGCVDGRIDVWMDGWMGGLIYKYELDRQKDGWMNESDRR